MSAKESRDEVELNDNLWASFVAYGIYALLFPTWWVLGKAGMAGEPNDWAIYLVVLTAVSNLLRGGHLATAAR